MFRYFPVLAHGRNCSSQAIIALVGKTLSLKDVSILQFC
jgi:hypothetical protein